MDVRPRLTMRYFLRVMLVFGVLPLIFYAVAAVFCFAIASYLLSHHGMGAVELALDTKWGQMVVIHESNSILVLD